MHLYLIRHAQSYVNLPDWAEGNTDAALTDLGREQAEALARKFSQEVTSVDALYASDMMRAKETAKTLAEPYGLSPIFDSHLREVGNNRRDHTPYPVNDLPKRYAEFWGSSRPFSALMPDAEAGESWMRVGQFLETLVERHYRTSDEKPEGDTVIVVCHGGVIEAASSRRRSATSSISDIGNTARCGRITPG